MQKLAAAVTILYLAGCGGGGSPTGAPTPLPTPTPTPPPVLSFTDGTTDTPLTPALVSPPGAKVGDMVTASLAGYLTREQKWIGLPIALWPVPDGGEGAHRDLIHGGEAERPLVRWSSMTLTAVVPDPASDWASEVPRIKDAIGALLAEIAAAGGPTTTWADASYGSITVRVDPADECLEGRYAACTRWWRDGSTITRAELIFDRVDYALEPRLVDHMLGYAMGLADWAQSGAAMNPSWNQRGSSYHEVERNALHMMYQHRNPGNLLPDRDPAFAPASGARTKEVRVERRPW